MRISQIIAGIPSPADVVEHFESQIRDEFNFCWCGPIWQDETDTEAPLCYLLAVLRKIEEVRNHNDLLGWRIDAPYRDPVEELATITGNKASAFFVLYWLDTQEITEHGSGIGGSWLTEKGEVLLGRLKALQKLKDEGAA